MKLLIKLGIAVILIGSGIFYFDYTSSADACCGKCTGSSYCSACTNCSRCKHCSAGGSCGVCRSSEPEPAPKPKVKVAHVETNSSSNSRSNSNTITNLVTSSQYYVNSKTLNIRDNPSTDGKVLYAAKSGEVVTVLNTVNSQWVQVKINDITGYAFKQLLTVK